MSSLHARKLRLAASAALLVLLAVVARAGDEDISPSPYQEFDPVTGYMVTVDPAPDQQQGHGPAADEAATEQAAAVAENDGGFSWLHAAMAAAAMIAAAGLLRRRRRIQAAAGH
jgi:hypothetical protein